MTSRTELKEIVKEAIMELVKEGKVQVSASGSSIHSVGGQPNAIRASGNHLAEMIRSNVSNKVDKTSKEATFMNLLADTAQTTYVRQQEIESFGQTTEQKESFESMFPSELVEQFQNMFNK